MSSQTKPILCVDFDGVLHSYSSGWQGADVVADPPVDGAIAFMREASKHFRVAVHSSRSLQPGGMEAMKTWLTRCALNQSRLDDDLTWLDLVQWPLEKPAAFVTIDDRALTFTGTWPAIETLLSFKPWNKR